MAFNAPTLNFQFISDLSLIIIGIIGIYIFLKMRRFIFTELKTSIRETKWESMKNTLAGFLFTIISAFALIFISALVISSIAISIIFAFQEIKLIYFDAMIKPLQYSTVIPVVFVVIFIYIFFYPLMEFMLIAQKSEDGPMEVQKWIKWRILSKFSHPWNKGIAIILALLAMLGIPAIIYYLVVKMNIASTFINPIENIWLAGLIIVAYTALLPIFYLAFYGTYGTAQSIVEGGQFLKEKRRWGKIKGSRSKIILFIVAIISVLSIIYRFVEFLPVLWGEMPEVSTSYSEVQHGLLENIVVMILRNIPNLPPNVLTNFQIFNAFIPLDFLLFFITTVLFSVIGFYSDFLKKESLNRTNMVLFAAYIICGIAFEILLWTIVSWPWVLPDEYLALELADPNDQAIIVFFFAPALLIVNLFYIIFLIYNTFFNQSLRNTITQGLLNNAIKEKKYDIVFKYSKSKDPNIRYLVASCLEHIYSDISEEGLTQERFIEIFQNLIEETQQSIVELTTLTLSQVLETTDIDQLGGIFERIFKLDEKFAITLENFSSVLIQYATKNPKYIVKIFTRILSNQMTKTGQSGVMQLAKEVSYNHPKEIAQVCMMLFDSADENLATGAVILIRQFIGTLNAEIAKIYEKTLKISQNGNQHMKKNALGVLGTIAAFNPDIIAHFLKDVQQYPITESGFAQEFLGAGASIISNHPNRFEAVWKHLVNYTTSTSKEIQEDFALSLGIIGMSIPKPDYFGKVHSTIQQMLKGADTPLKQALLQSMTMIANTRSDLCQETAFQVTLLEYVNESEPELRNQIYSFFEKSDPTPFLKAMILLLRQSAGIERSSTVIKKENLIDLMHYFYAAWENIQATVDIKDLLVALTAFKQNDPPIFTQACVLISKICQESLEGLIICQEYLTSCEESKDPAILLPIFGLLGHWINKAQEIKGKRQKTAIEEKLLSVFNESVLIEKAIQMLEISKKQKNFTAIASVIFRFFADILPNRSIHAEFHQKVSLAVKNSLDAVKVSGDPRVVLGILDTMLATEHEIPWDWEKNLQPICQQLLKIKIKLERDLLKHLFDSLAKIAAHEPKFIQNICVFACTKTNNRENRIESIEIIARLEPIIKDKTILLKIVKNLGSSDASIKIATLKAISNILMHSIGQEAIEGYSQNQKKRPHDEKIIEKILLRFLGFQLNRDKSQEVRKSFIQQLVKIVKKYPQFMEPLLILKNALNDNSEDIAKESIRGLLEITNHNPDQAEQILNYVNEVVNSPYLSVKIEIIQQYQKILRKMLEAPNEMIIKQVHVGLVKMLIDFDASIRKRVYPLLKREFDKHTSDFLNHYQVYFQLVMEPDTIAQRDGFRLLTLYLMQMEEYKEKELKKTLFRQILRYGKFNNIQLQREIAENISRIHAHFVKDAERLVALIYHLIITLDKIVIRNAEGPLKEILLTQPSLKPQIIENLNKVHQNSQNKDLEKLLLSIT